MGFFFVGMLILVVYFLVLWNRGRAGWETLQISLGAKKRRSADVSAEGAPLPPELKLYVEELTRLGFERLGEVQVAVPGGMAVKSRIYASSDRTVFAELAETGGLAVFYTVHPDDAVVETGFPLGENIHTRYFRSHTILGGLEQAYRHQTSQAEEFARIHGQPRRVAAIGEYLEFESMYRRTHVARKMRRHTRLAVLEIAALIVGILALLAAVVYWLGSDMTTIEPLILVTFLLAAALTPVALGSFFIPFLGDWGDRRETGKKIR